MLLETLEDLLPWLEPGVDTDLLLALLAILLCDTIITMARLFYALTFNNIWKKSRHETKLFICQFYFKWSKFTHQVYRHTIFGRVGHMRVFSIIVEKTYIFWHCATFLEKTSLVKWYHFTFWKIFGLKKAFCELKGTPFGFFGTMILFQKETIWKFFSQNGSKFYETLRCQIGPFGRRNWKIKVVPFSA